MTLSDAHRAARVERERVAQGEDPVIVRKAAKSALAAAQAQAITFSQASALLLDAKASEWRNAKHAAQWARTLETYAYPVIGKVLVQDVDQALVLAILQPIWSSKTETATRLRGRIEQVLDWAHVRGLRSGENPARWRGRLDKLLAKPKKISKVVHHRTLPVAAIGKFMVELRKREGLAPRALELAVLTAARSGEVRGMVWSEVDLDAAVWTIPESRMKAGKEHRVPLSTQAVDLLRALPQIAGSELVFQGTRGKALSDMSLTAVLRRMEVDAVPHGFRSTFRDWASELTTYPPHLAEMALAHAIADKVEAAYRRGDMFDKRRQMMTAWANYCAKSPAFGQVVALRQIA